MLATIETEKQIHDLRVGLKFIACLLSPLLTLNLFISIAKAAKARAFLAEMGDVELPVLTRILFSNSILLQGLPVLSLLVFLALLFTCFRHRNAAFLYLSGASLAAHLLLIWLINWFAFLPIVHVIQSLQ